MRWTALTLALLFGAGTLPAMADGVPEFTHHSAAEWINSAPLKLADLKGEVVLIEFWTFDCYNCRNTLPWLKAVHAEYAARGLKVVSVHTPELPQERDIKQVRAAITELGVTYPVMIDTDFSYWRAMNNRYWPAFYLLGRDGQVATRAIGELHRGEKRGDDMEAAIRSALAR
jgi:thiol-disulfide isomerase/thioredoxin